ncbi:mediator of RNA polymerase II transcription subunit 22 isoform X1 [Drosophila mauritiana]|uniref:Mediator of RNA polymerase II transcription subunit 22 n=1 Tax=Drosophila mauritiana TaxID=7226 RepID=A0A6P8J689_DROMA|nr:mediator of RNA polymerase II transcription subunit 22 isoform X1 [Drosophila mauritiana]XP_033151124.1 mediator of RNA polymerase II transcription subunit 22 isoform X1 [Drosophila mauritiana]XP_033151125.1 mediator of RNA polymerase II transcription subunit 22 isoform X1 [Drosophila mauritiana]
MAESSIALSKDEALLKSFKTQLKDNVLSMLVNFEELIKLVSPKTPGQITNNTEQELNAYEMQVRAGNFVRAEEALIKLVHDVKEYQIIYDHSFVEEEMDRQSESMDAKVVECDEALIKIVRDLEDELLDLEDEYYEKSGGPY